MSSSPAPVASLLPTLPPSPPPPPEVAANDTSPPSYATPVEPITSSPSPTPTNTVPPVTSPPPPPITSVSPVSSPPALIPPVVSPPPPAAPIPPATKPPPPISSPPPEPPVPPGTAPTPPTTIKTPETSPPPPPTSTITPITSPPSPITPLVPAISPPPPPDTPLAPSNSPPPLPPTTTTPSDPPPSALPSPPPPPSAFTPPSPLTHGSVTSPLPPSALPSSPPPPSAFTPPSPLTHGSVTSPLPPSALPSPPRAFTPQSPLTHGSVTSPPPLAEPVNGSSLVNPGVLQQPASNPYNTSTALIVGVAIGGIFLLFVFSVLCICFFKRRRRENCPMNYYRPPSPGLKDNCYAAPPQQLQQNLHLPGTHVITVLANPFPSPPLMSSSGGYGSNNSGFENPFSPQAPGAALGFSSIIFTYDELVVATGGFSEANLLGQGGFGYVHKGILLNGKEVAVKQLKIGSRQGEREFQAEVETISRVHHKHLVSLVGYCIAGAERLLVYEFVPNNTLEFHLHGKGQPIMEWATRLKIAIGSAKGLAYLHEDCNPTVIHRDIKATNILLDFKFEAKVSDFGLAKFFSDTNTHITHISTRVVGTFGYLAPEYASSGKVTHKSDVFSYGVMLLELITGCLPINSTESLMNQSLVEWARPLLTRALEDGNFDTLVDPRLQRNYNTNEMASMVACAAACVRHSAWRRPRMSQIVHALEEDVSSMNLYEGIRPGHSTVDGSYESSNYDGHQYKENMKKFNMTLESQDYGISKCSDNTSEYGLYPSSSSSDSQQTTQELEIGKMKRANVSAETFGS